MRSSIPPVYPYPESGATAGRGRIDDATIDDPAGPFLIDTAIVVV
jgi:hypothetical protein